MIDIASPAITGVAGAAMGYVMKLKAQELKDRTDVFKMALQTRQEASKFADKAAKRDGSVGKATRRLIVLLVVAMFGSLVFVPFFDVPVVVESVKTSPKFLWGLFGGNERVVYETVKGFFLPPEVRSALGLVIGFYFGQGAAKV